MDCPLNNTFLLTFRTLVWRILSVRALTVVSCYGIFPNPSRQYSKCQTRGEAIEKCLDEGLEPTYYFSIFNSGFDSYEEVSNNKEKPQKYENVDYSEERNTHQGFGENSFPSYENLDEEDERYENIQPPLNYQNIEFAPIPLPPQGLYRGFDFLN